MALDIYHTKRDFSRTPEPSGTSKAAKPKNKQLAFVVQEHHASRLHYDFRLELDGVLKSWAIPKGPSLDPHDHHLAIMTEDHPYEYRLFEGVIPKGNYGAGNVIIWDDGWYEPRQGDPLHPEAAVRDGLGKGHMTFIVHGKKLRGEFALIKMSHMQEGSWLLVKKGDQFADVHDVTVQDTSVKSGKRVDELTDSTVLPDLSRLPKKAAPRRVKPMLATLADEIFDNDDWLFEIKWDGYRAIGASHNGTVELYSRIGTDFTAHYPPLVKALRAIQHDVVVDGEIVVTDKEGVAHFEWLQQWRHAPEGNLEYYLFDILWLDGHDTRGMPLSERKNLLRAIIPGDTPLRYSDHVETHGISLFNEMHTRGLEGVVAKQAVSSYREGARGKQWLKIKTHLRQEVVIGGYTEPRGGRKYLGALLVGVYDKDAFIYVGHSGGGIPDEQRKLLLEKLQKLARKTSPFATEPTPNAPVHWVKPEVVCEMSFSEWTDDGFMRQPQFRGVRADKKPKTIRRERPKAHVVPSARKKERIMNETGIAFSHLDKVFFPKHGYTKGDILEYYKSVADAMLPYLKDRPHSMLRQPDGIQGESFFQKNNPHLPGWVPHVDIFSESHKADLRWVLGGALDTLLYMVQLGTIEINPWNSRVGHLDKPDWIVIDLDPEGRTFKEVVQVAHSVKAVCDEWGIVTYPKTSGKTGIHIYIPMHARYTYEQAKNVAHFIALEVTARQPKLTSVERMPDKRQHKIYIDFLQNREGQTLAAPYSIRPTPDATVSAPLHWHEVTPALKPTDFTIKNMAARLKKIGDIWQPVIGKGIDLAAVLRNIELSG